MSSDSDNNENGNNSDESAQAAAALLRDFTRSQHNEHNEALYLTSSFMFDSAADAAARFNLKQQDNYVYSRFTNPTLTTFQNRMALLEGGECALATASGMSTILSVLMSCCHQGARVLCAANVFGATRSLLQNYFAKMGVQVTFVYESDAAAWRAAAKDGASLLLIETPSNPLHEVYDIAALAKVAHKHGALLAVDNCFCAGAQQPLKHGADIVIHSATKYLDGQGRALGGVVVGSESLLMQRIHPFIRQGGCICSPFNAWLFSRGLETLSLRMNAHCESALKIAEWLQQHPAIKQVWHTALASHPQHALAMRQQNQKGSGIITIELHGEQTTAWHFIDALKHFSITANFGDVKSTVTHPATTTHSQLSEAEQTKIRITKSIVRLSIGLEPPDILTTDLNQALEQTQMV